ncbi:MAG: alpha-L-fucosidase [Bacteroidales bacterium]|nr:alpha-L-fucosidase [Bacteroidales bacterium]
MNRVMNIKSILQFALLGFVFLALTSCNTNHSKTEQSEHVVASEARMKWENQKFSMFIHWGLYSIPAGVWEGEKVSGYSEQIKGHAKISTGEYRKLASQFNPINWNADSVALLAKRAGMKSIIITSKHHDGFCMFDSKYTGFDIVDATPYKKDVLKDLSEACKRHGLSFGVYFSLIDWDYEGALPFESVRNSDSIPPLHHKYNLNQIEELLTQYGEVSEIWFDMGSPTYDQSREIATLVKNLQPNCMISGRLWNDQGDFVVMGDNLKPDFKMGVPWQTPASMFNETWSYRSWQERPSVEEKIKEKIRDLISVVSMGGNYLLNIGPKADGSIVPFEKEVLEGIGLWLDENGEAIYSTTLSPIDEQTWGSITAKGGKLYLHIIDFPENNKIIIEGLNSLIKRAYPLSNPKISLKTNHSSKQKPNRFELDVSKIKNRNKYATIVVLEHEGDFAYSPKNAIFPNEKDAFILTLDNATKFHSLSGHDYYSTKPTIVKLKWFLQDNKKESYTLNLSLLSDAVESLELSINKKDYLISFPEGKNNFGNELVNHEIKDVKLNINTTHEVKLSLKDKSNQHKGLSIKDLQIEIK